MSKSSTASFRHAYFKSFSLSIVSKRSMPSTLLDIRQIRNQENSFLTFEVGYTSLIAYGDRDS